ncbi:integrase arm-type DNA-binding domain-containing protein [Burkholderia cepacia]|uniref:integrase arm-type DNA-binding domain-containing protein n=1 Tax=Burkholderia cepacia TaxID=292 RepID=UPI001FC802E2|nr:integrase arm-type DNA-binding domain-containing protein [Burkholderia cepacia]
MAGRQLHRLSALRVAKAVDPGHYADGGGLFMQIAGSGARSWVFRFTLDRRVREMGLGPLSRVSLGEARKLATRYREMVGDQVDPILARREEQRRRLLDISVDANVTFREAAEAFIRAHESEWRNRKHSQQWDNTLKTYAYPIIGDVRVRDIDTAMMRIRSTVWMTLAGSSTGFLSSDPTMSTPISSGVFRCVGGLCDKRGQRMAPCVPIHVADQRRLHKASAIGLTIEGGIGRHEHTRFVTACSLVLRYFRNHRSSVAETRRNLPKTDDVIRRRLWRRSADEGIVR